MVSKNNYGIIFEDVKKIVNKVNNSESELEKLCDVPKTLNSGIFTSLYKDITLIHAGSNNKYRLRANTLDDVPQVIIAFGGENNSFEVEGGNALVITYGGKNNEISGAMVRPYEFFEKNNKVSRSYNGSSLNGSKTSVRELVLDEY